MRNTFFLILSMACISMASVLASASPLSTASDSELVAELAGRGITCSAPAPAFTYRANCFDVFFDVYRTNLSTGEESHIVSISLGSAQACADYGPEMIRKIGRFSTGGQVAYCTVGFLNTLTLLLDGSYKQSSSFPGDSCPEQAHAINHN